MDWIRRAGEQVSSAVSGVSDAASDAWQGIANSDLLEQSGIGRPLTVDTEALDGARRWLMSPFADSDQTDGQQVVVADTGSDMDAWTWLTGQEQADGGLEGIVDAVERNADGTPVDSVEFKSHGWENGQEVADGDGGVVAGRLTDEQREQYERLGSLVSEDGEILMAGCNVAQDYVQHHEAGDSTLDQIAAASGRDVTAGVAIQLPLDGIEGSSITVHPDGSYTYDTSSAKQTYDVTANGLGALGSAFTNEHNSWSDSFSQAGSTLWDMGSDYLDIGMDVVNGTRNAEGWTPPGATR